MKASFDTALAFLALTKPSILLLVLITGAAGIVFEGSLTDDPLRFVLALIGLALAGGSANGLNQYLERERDALMARTRLRRPLPLARISPAAAAVFSIVIGVVSIALFGAVFNALAAALALATILYYSLYYTIYLKPRTPLNIVIGGAAGAMAPVIGWAAASGSMAIEPWLLFAIVFFWTPPHFWALAVSTADDYRRTGLPMMPLVVGERKTWNASLRYVVLTFIFSLLPALAGAGVYYLIAAVVLGALFFQRVARARRLATPQTSWGVFRYSIVYLMALFTVLIADLRWGTPLF